jgi:hypothetical protein
MKTENREMKTSRITRNHEHLKEARKDAPLELSEGTWPCSQMISGFCHFMPANL